MEGEADESYVFPGEIPSEIPEQFEVPEAMKGFDHNEFLRKHYNGMAELVNLISDRMANENVAHDLKSYRAETDAMTESLLKMKKEAQDLKDEANSRGEPVFVIPPVLNEAIESLAPPKGAEENMD